MDPMGYIALYTFGFEFELSKSFISGFPRVFENALVAPKTPVSADGQSISESPCGARRLPSGR